MPLKILQTAATEIRLQPHVSNQIVAVTSSRGHDPGQLRRTARRRAVRGCLTHGLASLKRAVLQADHGPPNRFLHAAGWSRCLQAGTPRSSPGDVEAKTRIGRQGCGLQELFDGLLLDLVKQGRQAQFGRFFSSA